MGWANNGSGSGGQAWYDMTIACDPNAENTIYVGGVNIGSRPTAVPPGQL